MAKFLVGAESELAEGIMKKITAAGKEILVCNIHGNYFATDNTCKHAGAELHEGSLNDNVLTCPWHGAKWDITNGNLIWFPQKLGSLQTYNVIKESGMIYLEF